MKIISGLVLMCVSKVLAFNPTNLPGVSKPMNFFDPLGFSKDKTELEFKKLQESEIKHGRVAMLSTLGLLTQKYIHPIMEGEIGSPIYHWQLVSSKYPNLTKSVITLIAVAEFYGILKSWQLTSKNGIAELKEEYTTGKLVVNLVEDDDQFKDFRTREINNGRLAMIATLILVIQELSKSM